MGSRWARLWAVVLFAAFACATARLAVADPTYGVSPVPIDLRLGVDPASTRLVLDLAKAPSRPITAKLTGGRLAITAADAAPMAELDGHGRGLVTDWRIVPREGDAQIVADTAPGVEIRRHFMIPPSGDIAVWRYVIDLAVASPAIATPPLEVATASRLPPAPDGLEAVAEDVRRLQADEKRAARPPRIVVASASPVTAPHPVTTSRVDFAAPPPTFGRQIVIVIDPGHGGHDTGAQSLVRNEKDINLAAGLDLRARLERSGRYRVVMTRDTDVFIPLAQRVQIARRAKADLFISLHSDSAGVDPTPHGASVYTLSDRGVTRVGDVIGPRGLFSGDAHSPTSAVRQILLDLTQRTTRNRSAEFAGVLMAHLSGEVDLLPHSQRDADYYVLLAPDVPAVLLEMGFITNPADELRLTDPADLRSMMDHVGDAIDEYFAPHAQLAAE